VPAAGAGTMNGAMNGFNALPLRAYSNTIASMSNP
jgi:hypothetical protein